MTNKPLGGAPARRLARRKLLRALLVPLASCLPAQWCWANRRWPDERQAGPFLCHADFPLAPHQALLDELDTLQRDVTGTLGIRQPGESIHLFWFRRKATYQNYVRYYFPRVPERRALFIKQRGPGMVFAYLHRDFAVDVRHESSHALLHATLPMVPLWLDEGLAEYFEVPREQRLGNSPHLTTVRWHARLGVVPSIDQLEQLAELEQMGRAQYRDAWAWVHFMLHGDPAAQDELRRYLADIESRTPPGRLSHRLRRRMPDVERQFAEHFKRWKS